MFGTLPIHENLSWTISIWGVIVLLTMAIAIWESNRPPSGRGGP